MSIERSYLCPPGNGVFTINTAKERKDSLHQRLYGVTGEKIFALWEKNLQEKLSPHRGGVLLGICSDCGGGILRGANWGPLFLRNELYTREISAKVFDLGDTRVIPHLLMDDYVNRETLDKCRQALYGSSEKELAVSPLSVAKDVVESFYQSFDDKGIIGLGGDHSVSFALTQPFLRRRKSQGRRVAIIHLDAHTDIMESRLGIDVCFGSWVYHILPDLISPAHIYQIGLRSSGQSEAYWEEKYGVQQFWSEEIKQKGGEQLALEIVYDLKQRKIDELYVSFDIDAIDISYASATGTPEAYGPEPHQLMILLECLGEHFPITAADMVEVAPFIKHHHDDYRNLEPDSTLTIAGNFIEFFIQALDKAY